MVAKIRDQMWKEVLEYASHMRVISSRTAKRCQLLQTALHSSTGYLLVACPGIVQED